jgi:hypothetical protein
MQGGAETHLRRLQIHNAGLLQLGEDPTQKRGYFARDLGLDRFGRFFLRCTRILGWSGTADLFIHLDEGSLHLPMTAEGLDLPLGLVLLGRRGEALADSLAVQPCRSTVDGDDDPDRPDGDKDNPDYRISHRFQ